MTAPRGAPQPVYGHTVYSGRWFIVNRLPLDRGRVTHRYEVLTLGGNLCLAYILWDASTYGYEFIPKSGSMWVSRVLGEIVAFLEQLKQEQERAPVRVPRETGEEKAL